MGETFRHPVVELAAPPQDLKRADELLPLPRKDSAVATGTSAILAPEPTPERKANRGNRKDASSHVGITIAKRLYTRVKGPGSDATHVEYLLSGSADAGSSPNLTRGVDSQSIAPSSTALKPGPSGVADAGASSDLRGRGEGGIHRIQRSC